MAWRLLFKGFCARSAQCLGARCCLKIKVTPAARCIVLDVVHLMTGLGYSSCKRYFFFADHILLALEGQSCPLHALRAWRWADTVNPSPFDKAIFHVLLCQAFFLAGLHTAADQQKAWGEDQANHGLFALLRQFQKAWCNHDCIRISEKLELTALRWRADVWILYGIGSTPNVRVCLVQLRLEVIFSCEVSVGSSIIFECDWCSSAW